MRTWPFGFTEFGGTIHQDDPSLFINLAQAEIRAPVFANGFPLVFFEDDGPGRPCDLSGSSGTLATSFCHFRSSISPHDGIRHHRPHR